MFHVCVFAEKPFNRLALVWLISTGFLNTMHETDTTAEVYLELFKTYVKIFGKIVNGLLTFLTL